MHADVRPVDRNRSASATAAVDSHTDFADRMAGTNIRCPTAQGKFAGLVPVAGIEVFLRTVIVAQRPSRKFLLCDDVDVLNEAQPPS